MKKFTRMVIVAILAAVSTFAYSQNINNIPKEVKLAFKKGTRLPDGRPGLNYWQNRSKYDINASLNAKTSTLSGEENIWYFNNSPDTLDRIVLRLYQNIFKYGNARGWSIGNVDLGDGCVIDSLKIEGGVKSSNTTSTNLIVRLEKLINPGDSTQVYIKWHFHIPEKRQVRMGNYGNDRFFIAYWYPQIAVYDDIDGWDMNEYLGATEFYNDFSDFNVNITVPENYNVWACGDLLYPEKHYSKNIMNKIDKAWKSGELVNIITAADRKADKVFSKKASNIWNFKAVYVPDFSFAATKNYNWDAKSVIVDTITERRVFVDAIYPDDPKTFANAAEWAAKSIEIMSFQLPGIPFPYEHMTSFSNGTPKGGMETPMMANNGDATSKTRSAGLFFHENSHSYFPFFMGTNERKYAWMDEGWASYLTYQMMDEVDPENNYLEYVSHRFENLNGSEKEVSLMTLSYNITDYNTYRIHAYNRSAMAYHFLRDALGDSVFKAALHEYIYRWQGRHPIPYDFFATMADASNTELLWFYLPWFFDKSVADLGIKKLTNKNEIVIENYGGLPLPVKLQIEYSDGSKDEIYKNTSIWNSGDKAVVILADAGRKIKKIELGDKVIPDTNRNNNIFVAETTSDK
jgi:hypothetical protein